MVKLSICYAVYNQSGYLKQRLTEISYYKDDDIEIIISDDGSTEDIKSLVDSFGDPRFHYTRTEGNRGLDLNIIHALKNCNSEYAYVFRSKDNVYPDKIKRVMETIEQNPDVGYFYFSAYDEVGAIRLRYKSRYYEKGKDAAYADFILPTHPSGNLYRVPDLDLNLYESCIKKNFNDGQGHIVHSLIRMDLSARKAIYVSHIFAWMYADTYRTGGVSANNENNKTSTFDPSYTYKRYECAFDFICSYIPNSIRKYYLKKIISDYYDMLLYRTNIWRTDGRHYSHYIGSVRKINIFNESRKLKKFTRDIAVRNELGKEEVKYINRTERILLFKYLTVYRIKRLIRDAIICHPGLYWRIRNIRERGVRN